MPVHWKHSHPLPRVHNAGRATRPNSQHNRHTHRQVCHWLSLGSTPLCLSTPERKPCVPSPMPLTDRQRRHTKLCVSVHLLSGEIVMLKDYLGEAQKTVDVLFYLSTVEDLIPRCSETLCWHQDFLQLVFEQHKFKYQYLAKHKTPWSSIINEPGTETYSLQLLLVAMPDDFRLHKGLCICAFGGCCRLCPVPTSGCDGGCVGCGNNACCRCKNCGCDCCAKDLNPSDLKVVCPMIGCKPEWAAYEDSDDDL